ncbi:BMP family ABC transporter substrate-binding protein [Bacillus sp. Marseille-P3661]|uniref:BMP family ABC transporter substrate-binding protein n=1 Tax=Bacillus sp. Marseille-P3661 TaxID=1936234 RepID=UPI000C867661|nr:BMP family ABC transporter substrate-binding protein [Bacillus sp. Marseille-P3661]
MLKKLFLALLTILVLCTACGQSVSTFKPLKSIKVGLLLPETINDPVWGNKGYKGLLKIQSEYNAEVFYKEGITTLKSVEEALREFSEREVNIVFGHGSEYGTLFQEVHKTYPEINFFYFNGDFSADNVTSLKFESHAMGFFGGMIAAKMSKTNNIGIIAAFDWQPEIEGFKEGAKYQNPEIHVLTEYTKSWNNEDRAVSAYENMRASGVDVFYPAGDTFNLEVIEKVKEDGLYAIGFVSDQSDLGESIVLTSTVQHVDHLYELVVAQYLDGTLENGIITFDFKDDVISLGKFSPEIPEDFRKQVEDAINLYKLKGELPSK